MKRPRGVILFTLITWLVGMALACAQATPTPTPTPAITVTDDAGRTVTLSQVPRRIVSLAPSNTEILFALGLGDRVVGVSDFSDYPPEALTKPKVVSGTRVNMEEVVRLSPDLVVAAGITNPEDITQLDKLGLKVLVLTDKTTIEGILDQITLVGKATSAETAATQLTAKLRSKLTALIAAVHEQARPQADTPEAQQDEEQRAVEYTVQPGDTLWAIAERFYGTGYEYPRLVKVNAGRQMPDGRRFTNTGVIHPGWVLLVPLPSRAGEEVGWQTYYVVEEGDTLRGIAARLLGDEARWQTIFDLNRGTARLEDGRVLKDPDLIWPGLRLRVPSVTPGTVEKPSSTEKMNGVTTQPRVFYEIDASNPATPWTAGPGSFIDDLLQRAGAVNIAAGAKAAWAEFSAEEIIRANPDIIILADAPYGVTVESVKARPGWGTIAAVQKGAIYPLDENQTSILSRPGPRIVDGLEALMRLVHPEVFGQ